MADGGGGGDDLAALRVQIDAADQQLVTLLNERARIALKIGAAKGASGGEAVYRPHRERAVLEKVAALNGGPLTNDALAAIYREVMGASIAMQAPGVQVAYLGPPGTHSHAAALARFGASVTHVPLPSIAAVVDHVTRHGDYGVVPLENSVSGAVAQTLDALAVDTAARIVGEAYVVVHHHLMVDAEAVPEEGADPQSYYRHIRRVYSHPEALKQCAAFLDAHLPHAERIPVASTAHAAATVAAESRRGALCAALCSDACAELYALRALATHCEADPGTNTTRFAVLALSPSPMGDADPGRDRTLIRFTVDHARPGALCDALRAFKDHGVNLTRIDTRPDRNAAHRRDHGRTWHYVFFVEMQGNAELPHVDAAIRDVRAACGAEVVVLGSYPVMDKNQTPSKPENNDYRGATATAGVDELAAASAPN